MELVPRQALALDLTRLSAGALRSTPRGIDRVELLYARHVLATWPGPLFAILATPLGPRLYDRERMRRGIKALEILWGENQDGAGCHGLRVAAALARLLRGGVSSGKAALTSLPLGALYVNVGHLGLSLGILDRLARRPDLKIVVMLHDLIPKQYPQLVTAKEGQYFARILARLDQVDGLILTTQAVAETVATALPTLTCQRLVSPLPVSTAFLSPPPVQPSRRAAPQKAYVLACGQVERRKNFAMLVDIWKALSEAGAAPAQLIIAGGDGDASDELSAQLRTWDPNQIIVRRVKGLTTPRLRDLMHGAKALLAPSSAEGFGLPIAEALSLNVPVIASNIPAHREVGGDHAIYIDPADKSAWLSAVQGLSHAPTLAAVRALIHGYAPRTPDAYFREIDAFLARFQT